MALKERTVISPRGFEMEADDRITVLFDYGLKENKDLDALLSKNPEYIFVAFVKKTEQQLIVFGDARRHEELKQAVEKDIGKVDDFVYGQLWFHGRRKADTLVLHSSPGKNDDEDVMTLSSFFESINSEFLHDKRVSIIWSLDVNYYYYTPTKTLKKYTKKK